ncbi:MAG: glycine cleavage system protein GcvH [Bacteroidales bacterium]|nr:glycine cleavage system protein GcvH [Bacteroidales bacterium]
MSQVLEGLLYSESHEWVKVEGNIAVIGISDYAQHSMGSIVYVDAPDVDDEFSQGEEFGAVESVKAASDLYCPVSGTVVEVNEDVLNDSTLLNKDPYGAWIIKVEMDNEDELKSLLSPEAYAEICK